MFKLAIKPTYITQVSGTLPGGHKLNFEVEFSRISQDDIGSLAKGNDAGDIIFADVCRQVVVGWKGVQDESGEIPFSSTAFEQVLAIYPMSKIIFDAWQASLTDARTKN